MRMRCGGQQVGQALLQKASMRVNFHGGCDPTCVDDGVGEALPDDGLSDAGGNEDWGCWR